MLQKVIFLFENCPPISAWIKKKRNLSLRKVQKEIRNYTKKKYLSKHRYNKDNADKYILFKYNWKLWNYEIIYLKITFEAKFHQNELNISKNLNPLEVVVYDEYCVTISVAVMAFYLMVFYENLYLLGMEYRIGLYNLLLNNYHIVDI